MKKKYIFVTIISALLVTIFLSIVMPDKWAYGDQHLIVTANLRVQKDMTVKMYYLTDGQQDYTESQKLEVSIKGSEEFQKISYIVPVDAITGIRLDLGEAPEYVDIEGISYYDGENDCNLGIQKIEKDFKLVNIEKANPGEEYLTIYSKNENPYIYSDCNMEYHWDKSHTNRPLYTVIIFVVLCVLFYILLNVFGEDVKAIYHSRNQIKALAMNDFRSRYVGSYLGRIWGIISPIMTILMFWFVFQVGLRSNPISNVPFILWLIAAMIPWNFFSDAWLSGNGAFTGYSYIVKKVVFNIDILPLVKILGSSILNVIFHVLIIIVYTAYGLFPGWHIIDMVYFSICLTVLALALSMITATLNVFMKDVGQFLGIVMQYLMWFTPIMWMYTMIPAKLSWMYKLNPLFYVTNGYRESLIDGVWFFERYDLMLYFWGFTFVCLLVGNYLMKKLKPHFADVL